jgi:hypothetical protein
MGSKLHLAMNKQTANKYWSSIEAKAASQDFAKVKTIIKSNVGLKVIRSAIHQQGGNKPGQALHVGQGRNNNKNSLRNANQQVGDVVPEKLRNIAVGITQDQIRAAFARFGTINDIHIALRNDR